MSIEPSKRSVASLALWLLRRQGTLERWTNRSAHFLSGLLLGKLDARELAWLTAALYDDRGDYEAKAIHPWEVEWFGKDLPPAPARLLVAGGGSGREVGYLLKAGYEVTAFDPAPSFVQLGQEQYPEARHLVGLLEDLLDPTSALAIGLPAPFDAVLIGWGVFSHLPGHERRRDILSALRKICPEGPLLASFFLADNWDPERSVARRIGLRLGSLLGGADHASEPGDFLAGRFGYAHWYSTSEIERLATESGHRLSRHPMESPGAYPHATFLPLTK